jgi:tetratricopeptide (TPR) repeat protein
MRKSYFFFFTVLVLFGSSIFAQEQEQGGEHNTYYYNEGLKSEKEGDFLDAKAAYQVVLFYAKDNSTAEIAKKKIAEMEAQIAREKSTALDAKEAVAKTETNNFPKAVGAELKFRTEYQGNEPFLQNSTSDLAKKILLNIKGINLAQGGDIASARKAFQEALDIDGSFSPARENLETIAKI